MVQTRPSLIEDPNDPGTFLIQDMYLAGVPSGNGGSSGGVGSYPTKLTWGASGERFYETGVDRGVLYLEGSSGIVWNGIVSVKEEPAGGEPTPYYLDGIKYLNYSSPEEFRATIEAYTYPDEFELCDGSAILANGFRINQQVRRPFGLSYRTRIGNDIYATDRGYKIHIVYNAMVAPTSREYSSMNDSPDAALFSWDISTRPVKFQDDAFGIKYGSHLVLDSTKMYPGTLQAIEEVLYGSDEVEPHLPLPQELLNIFVETALLQITDNGDGTWTATGPDEAIQMLNDTEFQLSWPSVEILSEDIFVVSTH